MVQIKTNKWPNRSPPEGHFLFVLRQEHLSLLILNQEIFMDILIHTEPLGC